MSLLGFRSTVKSSVTTNAEREEVIIVHDGPIGDTFWDISHWRPLEEAEEKCQAQVSSSFTHHKGS